MPTHQGSDTDRQKELVCAFEDAGLLLEFLGRRADNRLQSQFDDMRQKLAAPAPKVAVPPCEKYQDFLNGLAQAGRIVAGKPGDLTALDTMTPISDLSGRAFLLFSRDFLAAVAAPATVNSIRITQAYIEARRYPPWRRLAASLHWAAPVVPTSTKDGIAVSARRLASRVVCFERLTLMFTVITLLISAYAYSGQIILDRRQQIVAQYTQVGHDLGTYFREHGTTAADFNPQSAPPHCSVASEPAPSQALLAQQENRIPVTLATTSPDPSPEFMQKPRLQFDADRCALYWRLYSANQNMAAVMLHLVSWTHVVLSMPLADRTFGVVQSYIGTAAPVHPEICHLLGFYTGGDPQCSDALMDLMYRTEEVADSLLGCISLYLLPTFYGFLGAAASGMRSLRQKVDASLLTMSDRGRLLQDLILGALCGSIMALFVGYFGKWTASTGLGLSALALLAGYNVSGVLTFLDSLSGQAFKPAKAKES